VAENWEDGVVPSGTDSAVVAPGVAAKAYSATNSTPAYSGGLTLSTNSSLQIGFVNPQQSNDVNALGTGTITMNTGSSILLRRAATVTLPPIVLAGNASIDLSPSTSAHNQIPERSPLSATTATRRTLTSQTLSTA
jgi:hypothetical protein